MKPLSVSTLLRILKYITKWRCREERGLPAHSTRASGKVSVCLHLELAATVHKDASDSKLVAESQPIESHSPAPRNIFLRVECQASSLRAKQCLVSSRKTFQRFRGGIPSHPSLDLHRRRCEQCVAALHICIDVTTHQEFEHHHCILSRSHRKFCQALRQDLTRCRWSRPTGLPIDHYFPRLLQQASHGSRCS